MAFWLFQCDPRKYRLADRLADPRAEITWTVTRYQDQIRPGDVVFLWVSGAGRGIRAVMRVDEAPRAMPELESERRYWLPDDDGENRGELGARVRILGTLTHRSVDLSADSLRAVAELSNLSILRYQQGTNFRVTEDEGNVLMALIDGRPRDDTTADR